MSASLRDALGELAADVPALGDLPRAIADVEHRRTRRRRVLVGSLAVAAAAAVVVAGSVVRQDSAPQPGPVPPVVPGPSGQPWPTSVDLRGTALAPTLEQSPLPRGAALAVVQQIRAGASGQTALVVAGTEIRRVISGRGASVALSPDGRYLAYQTVGFGGDLFGVVDVTTGRSLVSGVFRTSDGTDAQTHQLMWSADGRHLLQLWSPTLWNMDDAVESARVWTVTDAGDLVRGPELVAIPGRLVALSADGGTLLAEDGGRVVASPTDREEWSPTGTPVPTGPAGSPRAPSLAGDGQNRWSPDGTLLAWSTVPTPVGPLVVDIVRAGDVLDGSAASDQRLAVPGVAGLLGWRGTDVVVAMGREEPTSVAVLHRDGSLETLSTLGPRLAQVSVAQEWLPGG